MKPLTQTVLLLTALFLCANFVVAQEQDRPKPDGWRGLVLDQSSPDDAIRVLGKPDKDKVGSLTIYELHRWVTKKHKEKIYRNLEFKLDKKEGVQKATLYFLNDKLVMITLDVKSGMVAPNGLSNIYGISFYPMVSAMDLAMFEKDYERNQGKIYPKTYPTVYSLVAVSERSFVSAMISNVPSFLGALGKSSGVPDEPGSFPGKVEFIQLISRTLENRDGADVLK